MNYSRISLDSPEFYLLKREFEDRINKTMEAMMEKGAANGTVNAKIDIQFRPFARPESTTGEFGIIPVFETKVSNNISWRDSATDKINQTGEKELISIEGQGFALVPIGGQISFADMLQDRVEDKIRDMAQYAEEQ